MFRILSKYYLRQIRTFSFCGLNLRKIEFPGLQKKATVNIYILLEQIKLKEYGKSPNPF